VSDARCTVCGRRAGGGWRCEGCQGPLDLPEVPATGLDELCGARLASGAPAAGVGVWRYAPWLPVPARYAGEISMGEGATAMLEAGAELPGVRLKLEFVSPTLSFKDRGAVVLVASALHRGATALIADSSGNAGSAIAAYAARAHLSCTVFVPASTSAAKQRQIRAYGAALEATPGDRTAAGEAAIAAVERTGAMYASHVYDPMFLQGTKTFAYECWEQLGGAPDAVLVPVGNGTLLLGAARGFRELRAACLIERLPRLVALQSERCAPLAQAWARGETTPVAITPGQATAAEGIAIPHPPRGTQILASVLETGGCVVAVPESAIGPAQQHLARRGLLVEPTAALVWAGALLARGHPAVAGVDSESRGRFVDAVGGRDAGTIVVPLCGSGLKSA
jgi:threonine synthase